MTRTQAVMGSPGYMSPEQMRSTKSVDGRSDIWSLGVILYELVAGRTPFQADTFSALCLKIAVDPHPPMLELPAKLPSGFEAVVNRALEKDPAMRYRSAAELAQALAPYAGASAREQAQRLVAANPGAMSSAAYQLMLGPHANTIDAASGQALGDPRPQRRRARSLLIAGAGIAAAAVLGVAIGVTPSSGGGGGREGAGMDPRAAPRRESPRPAAQPESITAHAPLDAGATFAAAPPSALAGSASGMPQPPGPPGIPLEPAGALPAPTAAAPTAPSKPKPRPATVDPYSSPD
jgi:serine/threonine-protein kinase